MSGLYGVHVDQPANYHSMFVEYPAAVSVEQHSIKDQVVDDDALEQQQAIQQRVDTGLVAQTNFQWVKEEGDVNEVLANAGMFTDCIVVTDERPSLVGGSSMNAVELAKNTAASVLSIPEGSPIEQSLDRVLLVWDGRVETARTVQKVVPLLKTVKVITVVTCFDINKSMSKQEDELQEICRYLKQNALNAEVCDFTGQVNDLKTLVARAVDWENYDLAISGAYQNNKLESLLNQHELDLLLKSGNIPVITSS
jgi:hypothetical protein